MSAGSGNTPKFDDCRCDFCSPDGTCDKVAMRFGWCGAMKLLAAIDAIEEQQ